MTGFFSGPLPWEVGPARCLPLADGRGIEEAASSFQVLGADSPVGEVERHQSFYESGQDNCGEFAAFDAVVGGKDQAARCAAAS